VEHGWIIALLRIFPKLAWRFSDLFFFPWLEKIAPKQCDIILIIKGEGISPNFLKKLRSRYQNAQFILYLWDSLSNCKHIELKFPFFDDYYSFDPSDCKDFPQFTFRPLFFLDKYLTNGNTSEGKGIFFVGTLNGDRPRVISRLLSTLDQQVRFNYFLFVRSRIELALRRLIDKHLRKLGDDRLIFKPISTETLVNHINNCAAVLDIEHPNQTGLTMRTFEVIASGKKLITTNKSILGQDFYDATRIHVIDRVTPIVSNDFLDSELPPLSEDFILKNSLRGWLSAILGVKISEAG
ncbi:MAG: hypothetical protein Q8J76_12830, partial [Desulfobulbaceae bacterium]|nr:hypothetical protein [Desulfobulbaceae bacterium]